LLGHRAAAFIANGRQVRRDQVESKGGG